MMTRKHFQSVADAIASSLPAATDNEFDRGRLCAIEEAVASLCGTFSTENPNFDTDKFLTACGLRD